MITTDHASPYLPNGNRTVDQWLILHDLSLLLPPFYNRIRVVSGAFVPKATQAEIRAFLWNSHGRVQEVHRLISNSQITRVEQHLELTRKRAATTARGKRRSHESLFKRRRFWNFSYPYGIADIAAEDMIDLDEARIKTAHGNRKIRKGAKGERVREDGPYGHDSKLTIC